MLELLTLSRVSSGETGGANCATWQRNPSPSATGKSQRITSSETKRLPDVLAIHEYIARPEVLMMPFH